MDLTHFPVHKGFRMRGEAITWLETFVDAAFAFVVGSRVAAPVLQRDAAPQ